MIISNAHRTIGAVTATCDEAGLRQVEEGAPLVLWDSVSFLAGGTPVEYYYARYRGDRSTFEVKLVREGGEL